MNQQKILRAGKIASQVREYAKQIVKPGVLLLEIAEKIETKIRELGGEPAFPTNLSINEIAAHYTPNYNDETKAHGLLKIDLGVHIDGWVADTAFSVDLENSDENKKLIQASKEALNAALKISNKNITLSEIGKAVQEKIESYGFAPLINLTGHSIEEYDLHSGICIPNIKNNSKEKLGAGLFAIEPFATNGSGKVHDGKPSGIYQVVDERLPRSQNAREILEFIIENYQTLPFCSRWIYNKFKAKGLFALRELEANGNLHQYAQLTEKPSSKVAQTEHTILIDKEIKITTE